MMSKVNTDFKNVTPFKGWWIAKRIVGLESYLVEGDAYAITHQTIGDGSDKYYCIECAAHPNGGMWALAERGEYKHVKANSYQEAEITLNKHGSYDIGVNGADGYSLLGQGTLHKSPLLGDYIEFEIGVML